MPGSRRARRRDGLPLRLAEVLLAASDPVDLAAWSALLAPDVHLRIGNGPVATSRQAAIFALSALLGRAASIGAGFRALWPSPDGETIMLEVELSPAPGAERLPIAIILRATEPDPFVRDLRIYLDPAPLSARATESLGMMRDGRRP